MREPTPQTILLKDYTPPAFLNPETALTNSIMLSIVVLVCFDRPPFGSQA